MSVGATETGRRERLRVALLLVAGYSLVLTIAARDVVFGDRTIGPERRLDLAHFYGTEVDTARNYDDETPILSDYPRDRLIADSLRGGFHWWNPWMGTGVPLMAEQGGPFFPLRLPFYLWPTPSTFTLFRLSRLVFAALGAYLFGRSRGLTRFGAFIGGALFELSGPLIWQAPYAGSSASYCLPWVLWAMSFTFQANRVLAIGLCGATIGLVGLGGHPSLEVIVGLGVAFAFVGHAITEWRKAPYALVTLVAGVLLAVLVSAASTWPFLELFNEGFTYKSTHQGPEHWRESLSFVRGTWWLALFLPGFIEPIRDHSSSYPYMLNTLSGVVTVWLAVVALVVSWRKRRWDLPLLIMFAGAVIIALHPPGFDWLRSLPGVSSILPRYVFTVVALVLAQWAADGLETLARAPARLRGRVVGLASLTFVLLGFVLSATVDDGVKHELVKALKADRTDAMGWPFVFLVIVVGVSQLRRLSSVAASVVLAVAALAELVVHERAHLSEPVSRVLREGLPTRVTELAARARTEHARAGSNEGGFAEAQYNLLARLPDLRVTAALVPKRYRDFMKLVNSGEFFTVYSPAVVASPLLDAAAMRFLLLRNAPDDASLTRLEALPKGGVFLNGASSSRARFVGVISAVESPEAAIEWLKRADLRGRHLSGSPIEREAVLERVGDV